MNYFVQLQKGSPFGEIFPKRLVPVKQVPLPNTWSTRGVPQMTFVTCALCGDAREPEPCLWLDWARVAEPQRGWLATIVASLRGGTPSEVLAYMDRGGDMPIRVSQTFGAPFPL